MPTLNYTVYTAPRPADRPDDYMNHHIPHAQRAMGALPISHPSNLVYKPLFSPRTVANYERGQLLFGEGQHADSHKKSGKKHVKNACLGSRTPDYSVVPRKRTADPIDNLNKEETQARKKRVEYEPASSLFSRIFANVGVWVEKAKDRGRAVIRQIVGEDDQPEYIVFVPTGSEYSNKRRIVNTRRLMPGSCPSESPTSERSQSTTSPDTGNISNSKFITYNHAKHNPTPSLQTSNVPTGFTSSVQYSNRKIKYLFNKSKSKKGQHAKLQPKANKINKTESQTGNQVTRPEDNISNQTESQTGNHITYSAPGLPSTSQNVQGPFDSSLKRAHDSVADDDHDIPSKKTRKAETMAENGSQDKTQSKNVAAGRLMNRSPLRDALKKRFDPIPPQRMRIPKGTIISDPMGIKEDETVFTSTMNTVQSPRVSENEISKDLDTSSIPVSQKNQDLLDITHPTSMHEITRVQMSARVSEKAESSAAALLNDRPPLNTYREPEERPSTSSSNTSDDRQESSESPDSTEDADMPISHTKGNDRPNVESVSKKHTHRGHDTQNAGASSKLSRRADTEESSADELEKSVNITRWNLDVGDHINLRKAKPKHLDELMKQGPLIEAETQLKELEISDNRKGARKQEELAKQRIAEAEAEREAEQKKKKAEALKRDEESARKAAEEIKMTNRRLTLDEVIPPAEWDNVLSTLKEPHEKELSRNFAVKDLHTLVPKTTWLNDEVVNKYLSDLVQKACEKRGFTEQDRKEGKAPPYSNIPSQFWESLTQRGPEGVRNWARRPKLDQGRLLSCERVLIPICHSYHWRLVVISGTEKTIEYFDSLPHGSSQPYTKGVLDWVKAVLGSAFDSQQWSIIEGQRSPRQSNGSDCGVFVLQNARAVLLGLEFKPDLYNTSTEGILRVRHQIAARLIFGGLNWE